MAQKSVWAGEVNLSFLSRSHPKFLAYGMHNYANGYH